MSNSARCVHPACDCEVNGGEAYCSERCRKQVEEPLSDNHAGCPCGHDACSSANDDSNENA